LTKARSALNVKRNYTISTYIWQCSAAVLYRCRDTWRSWWTGICIEGRMGH